MIEQGVGANVLGSPARALAYLRDVLATQPWAPPLAAGEIVTTGTITDAQPVRAGETWHATFGTLPLRALTATIG
jgi:2-oxo-3-hexenedioate decarboxylase